MRVRIWLTMAGLGIVAALGAAPATPVGAQPPASASAVTDKAADQVAFDRIRQQQADAWARESGADFAATFTEDADFVTFNGDYFRGRPAIAAGLQNAFDNFIEDTRIRYLDEHVRYVERDNVTIVRTTCLLQGGQTECRQGSLSVNTNVLVRRHGGWMQSSFQNTRVVPLP